MISGPKLLAILVQRVNLADPNSAESIRRLDDGNYLYLNGQNGHFTFRDRTAIAVVRGLG